MCTWGKSWGRVCLGITGMALILHGFAAAEDLDRETPPARPRGPAAYIRVHDPSISGQLLQAINGAHERLGEAGCGRLFSDFEDLSGKPLADVLAERGESAQSHLGRLFFYDGTDRKLCRGRGAAAMTLPGSKVVYVCPAQFREVARQPRNAQATVIHELLHTLGLGENPPSSREITRRVIERCWY